MPSGLIKIMQVGPLLNHYELLKSIAAGGPSHKGAENKQLEAEGPLAQGDIAETLFVVSVMQISLL